MDISGEIDAKVDAKGRVVLPSDLLKQMEGVYRAGLVLNRGLDKCLVLYTKADWKKIEDKVNGLNQFVKKNREFARRMTGGKAEIDLDSANRFLIPKKLMEYAGLDKDVVFSANMGRIEIWNKEDYDLAMNVDPESFSDLAEDVFGGGDNAE